ncbi:hypothetical protein [Cognatiyoonia sp. IB215182]|uniref:hypothetical protein n=1 Tax=Cognatiyoonia sp. IB215182 TaxID=3097353 RepID=UPI002A0F0884|nr:hypothetical protein [Cognatiyoonia sp. IB215182]MDX8350777.1 hypothetical protein [Cognatiyoonia sp. IB215182]
MKNATCRIGCVLIFAFASACGGGGSSPAPTAPAEPPPSFSELQTDYQALLSSVGTVPYLDPIDLPATGSAQYEGVVKITGDVSMTELTGQMFLDINFQDRSVNGSAENFRLNDNTLLSGSLPLNETSIQLDLIPGERAFVGSFEDSRLTQPGVTYDFEGLGFDGWFQTTGSNDPSYVDGGVGGEMIIDDTPASFGDGIRETTDGYYVTEKVD